MGECTLFENGKRLANLFILQQNVVCTFVKSSRHKKGREGESAECSSRFKEHESNPTGLRGRKVARLSARVGRTPKSLCLIPCVRAELLCVARSRMAIRQWALQIAIWWISNKGSELDQTFVPFNDCWTESKTRPCSLTSGFCQWSWHLASVHSQSSLKSRNRSTVRKTQALETGCTRCWTFLKRFLGITIPGHHIACWHSDQDLIGHPNTHRGALRRRGARCYPAYK